MSVVGVGSASAMQSVSVEYDLEAQGFQIEEFTTPTQPLSQIIGRGSLQAVEGSIIAKNTTDQDFLIKRLCNAVQPNRKFAMYGVPFIGLLCWAMHLFRF